MLADVLDKDKARGPRSLRIKDRKQDPFIGGQVGNWKGSQVFPEAGTVTVHKLNWEHVAWSWPSWTCRFGFFGQIWATVSLSVSSALPSFLRSPGTLVTECESIYWSPACPWPLLRRLFYPCYSDWTLYILSSRSLAVFICPFVVLSNQSSELFHFILSCRIFQSSNPHLDFLCIFSFSGEICCSFICAHCWQLLVEALSWMLPEHPCQIIPASVSLRCWHLLTAFSHSSWDFPGSRCNTGSSVTLNIRVWCWDSISRQAPVSAGSPNTTVGAGSGTLLPSCWGGAHSASFLLGRRRPVLHLWDRYGTGVSSRSPRALHWRQGQAGKAGCLLWGAGMSVLAAHPVFPSYILLGISTSYRVMWEMESLIGKRICINIAEKQQRCLLRTRITTGVAAIPQPRQQAQTCKAPSGGGFPFLHLKRKKQITQPSSF